MIPTGAAIPDGTEIVAMSVAELLGPIAALATGVVVVAALAIVAGVIGDVRARRAVRRMVFPARVGGAEQPRSAA